MRAMLAVLLACGSTLLPGVAAAGISDVTPALRAQAEATCRADAQRLCADAMTDEATVVACMRPQRALLTAPCRRIFDEVVREIGR